MKLHNYSGALALLAVTLSSGVAFSQDKELVVVGTTAQDSAMRGTGINGGKDTIAPFEADNKAKVTINVLPGGAIQEALLRLGTLSHTDEDLIFVSQGMASPLVANFLEPLDPYLARNPIPGFPDNWVGAPVKAGMADGQHYLIPLRCGTWIYWGNVQNMKTAGIAETPRTPEELYEAAKKGTFLRPNGEQVYGFAVRGTSDQIPASLATVSAMFGGAIVNEAGEVVVNSPETVKAVEFLRRLYVEGIMPPNWTSVTPDELFTAGRLTFDVTNDNYQPRFEAPDALGPGGAVPFHVPLEDSLRANGVDFGSSQDFYWGVGILKGSTDKDLAYDLIRYLAQPSVEKDMIGNQNPPCTLATMAEVGKTSPASAVGAATMAISKSAMPGQPRIREATDAVAIAVQDIVVNGAPTQETLDQLADTLKDIFG